MEQVYRSGVIDLALRAGDAATALSPRLQSPALVDLWMKDVRQQADHLIQLQQDASDMVPPPGWEETHEAFLGAIEHYAASGSLLLEALERFELGRVRSAIDRLDQAATHLGNGAADVQHTIQLGSQRLTGP